MGRRTKKIKTGLKGYLESSP